MDLVDKYLNEADFIDLGGAKENIKSAFDIIKTMESWLDMSRALIINGRRNDAIKLSVKLNKKTVELNKAMKKIPSRKITNKKYSVSAFI